MQLRLSEDREQHRNLAQAGRVVRLGAVDGNPLRVVQPSDVDGAVADMPGPSVLLDDSLNAAFEAGKREVGIFPFVVGYVRDQQWPGKAAVTHTVLSYGRRRALADLCGKRVGAG